MSEKQKRISLRRTFFNLQTQMIERLRTNHDGVLHAVTKGDASELNWLNLLNTYLPKRYQSAKAFVVDSRECISDQIDIVVFDATYSPFLFCQDSALCVPAESVYAVFEVKEHLGSESLLAAAEKAQSVRRLTRTTVPIHHAGGIYEPKPLFTILAGILARRSSLTWRSPDGGLSRVDTFLPKLPQPAQLDLGCILEQGAFHAQFPTDASPIVEWSDPAEALIFFFVRLLTRLQTLGTVPALDIGAYYTQSRHLRDAP